MARTSPFCVSVSHIIEQGWHQRKEEHDATKQHRRPRDAQTKSGDNARRYSGHQYIVHFYH